MHTIDLTLPVKTLPRLSYRPRRLGKNPHKWKRIEAETWSGLMLKLQRLCADGEMYEFKGFNH